MILSFGYKNGSGRIPHDATVFDVRSLTHTEKDPTFIAKAEEIATYGQLHPGQAIAIGCEKGKHRSKVLADKVAQVLRRSVVHL